MDATKLAFSIFSKIRTFRTTSKTSPSHSSAWSIIIIILDHELHSDHVYTIPGECILVVIQMLAKERLSHFSAVLRGGGQATFVVNVYQELTFCGCEVNK